MTAVAAMSSASGIPEGNLRLLLSLLATYPLGALYSRIFIRRRGASSSDALWRQHLFSIVTGIALLYFNFGRDTVLLLIPPGVVWLLLRVLGPTRPAQYLCFIFCLGYLLAEYARHTWILNGAGSYVLNWSTPYCVMCLRLIGFAMDCADGRTSKPAPGATRAVAVTEKAASSSSKLKLSWESVALARVPSLLETYSYCLFFCGVLVGPQFPFAVYEKFLKRRAHPADGTKKEKGSAAEIDLFDAGQYARECLGVSIFYFAFAEIGKIVVPPEFVVSAAFAALPMWRKLAYCAAAGRVVLAKYLGVWKMNEGGCALAGISYNGVDAEGRPQWNGLMNVQPAMYETATSIGQVISSFNMNTNVWCKYYIFKRLRFLGNKTASSVITLLFLAIWHGFEPAYALAFLTEFLDVETENMVRSLLCRLFGGFAFNRPLHPHHHSMLNRMFRVLKSCLNWVFIVVLLGHGVLTFDLLSWHKISRFWSAVHYFPHFLFAVVFVLVRLLPRQSSQRHHQDVKTD